MQGRYKEETSKEMEKKYNSNPDKNIKNQNEMLGDGLQMEYEESIAFLKKKYKEAKEARKFSEKRKIELEHRINVLKSQEKLAISQFQNTKKKIEQILENRNKYEEKLRKNDPRARGNNLRKNDNYAQNRGNYMMNNNPKYIQNNMNINQEDIEKIREQIIDEINFEEGEKKKIENELELLESDPDYVVTNTPKMMYKNIMKNCIPTDELKPSVLTSRPFINGIEHLAEAICNYVKSGSASTTSSKRKSTNKDGNQVDKDCKQDIIIALGKGYFEFPPEEGGDGTRYIVTKDNAITKVFDPSVTGITAEVYNKILREMKASGKKPKFESENDPAVKELLKDKRYVLVPDDEQQFLVTDKLKRRQVAEEPQAGGRRHISDYA